MSPDNTSQAMRETNRVFEEEVVGKGDFSALERVFTKQARILPPGAEMIAGRDEIQAFRQQAAASTDSVEQREAA